MPLSLPIEHGANELLSLNALAFFARDDAGPAGPVIANSLSAGLDRRSHSPAVCPPGHTVAVSMYFTIGDQLVWHPSMGVGRLFVKYLAAVEEAIGVTAGARPVPGDPDDIRIDSESFGQFTARAQLSYRTSNHPVFREQLGVVLFPAIVMLQRAGLGDLVSDQDPEQMQRAAIFDEGMLLLPRPAESHRGQASASLGKVGPPGTAEPCPHRFR